MGTAVLVGVLSACHVAQNPELLVDLFFSLGSAVPAYVGYAFRRMSAAVYNKMFGKFNKFSNNFVARPALEAPEVEPELAEDNQAFTVIMVILILGWWLSADARPPSPADRD